MVETNISQALVGHQPRYAEHVNDIYYILMVIFIAMGMVLNALFPGLLAGIGQRNHKRLKKIIRSYNETGKTQ